MQTPNLQGVSTRLPKGPERLILPWLKVVHPLLGCSVQEQPRTGLITVGLALLWSVKHPGVPVEIIHVREQARIAVPPDAVREIVEISAMPGIAGIQEIFPAKVLMEDVRSVFRAEISEAISIGTLRPKPVPTGSTQRDFAGEERRRARASGGRDGEVLAASTAIADYGISDYARTAIALARELIAIHAKVPGRFIRNKKIIEAVDIRRRLDCLSVGRVGGIDSYSRDWIFIGIVNTAVQFIYRVTVRNCCEVGRAIG